MFSNILGTLKNQANKSVTTIATKASSQIAEAFGNAFPGMGGALTPAQGEQNGNPHYLVRIYQQGRGSQGVDVTGHIGDEFEMATTSEWSTPLKDGIIGMLPGGNTAASLARMFGKNPVSQASTLQVWQGTSQADYTITLSFFTNNDPYADVIVPLLKLKSLVSPSVNDSGAFDSPGPRLDPEVAAQLAATAISGSVSMVTDVIGQLTGQGLASLVPDSYMKKETTTNSQVAPNAKGSANNFTKTTLLSKHILNNIRLEIGNLVHFDSVVVKNVDPKFDMALLDGQTGLPAVCDISVTFTPLFLPSIQDWQSWLAKR